MEKKTGAVRERERENNLINPAETDLRSRCTAADSLDLHNPTAGLAVQLLATKIRHCENIK